LAIVDDETVDADDLALAGVDRSLDSVGGFRDLLLEPAGFDAGQRPAELLDPVELGAYSLLDLSGQCLDRIRAAQRIDHLGQPRLFEDHLLCPERQGCCLLRWNPERLVIRGVCSVWTPPRTAARRSASPDDVHQRLLCGQIRTPRTRRCEGLGCRVLGVEPVTMMLSHTLRAARRNLLSSSMSP
jgi:hypothetical protein